MKLLIIPKIEEGFAKSLSPDVKVIDYNAFNCIEVHPFIRTTPWEYVEIEINKGIKAGFIAQMLRVNIPIRIKLKDETVIDFEIVSRLAEIYPSHAGALRKAFVSKENIRAMLEKEGITYVR